MENEPAKASSNHLGDKRAKRMTATHWKMINARHPDLGGTCETSKTHVANHLAAVFLIGGPSHVASTFAGNAFGKEAPPKAEISVNTWSARKSKKKTQFLSGGSRQKLRSLEQILQTGQFPSRASWTVRTTYQVEPHMAIYRCHFAETRLASVHFFRKC